MTLSRVPLRLIPTPPQCPGRHANEELGCSFFRSRGSAAHPPTTRPSPRGWAAGRRAGCLQSLPRPAESRSPRRTSAPARPPPSLRPSWASGRFPRSPITTRRCLRRVRGSLRVSSTFCVDFRTSPCGFLENIPPATRPPWAPPAGSSSRRCSCSRLRDTPRPERRGRRAAASGSAPPPEGPYIADGVAPKRRVRPARSQARGAGRGSVGRQGWLGLPPPPATPTPPLPDSLPTLASRQPSGAISIVAGATACALTS